ncbi:MAG TPA: GNAT family N-acetyltransferase, partial [Micromonosporaceae bacterium]
MGHGRLVLAEDEAGAPIGFAATMPIGPMWMLTDLFVRPDAQRAGTGGQLLRAALADVDSWQTFSSQDRRAIALYGRSGASARWPLLYLHGRLDRAVSPTGWTVAVVDPAVAAAQERDWTGVDRSADYRYWTARPDSAAYLVSDRTGVSAAGCVSGSGGMRSVTHLCLAPGREAVGPVLSLLAELDGPARLYLPGPHPALPVLLRHGLMIEDFDLFMSTAGAPALNPHSAYHPGLC